MTIYLRVDLNNENQNCSINNYYLEEDAILKRKFIIFFASASERNWFQRPLPLNARSRSSASESCDAIETKVLEEVDSMFSRANILEFLAPGDNVSWQSLQ